MGGGIPYFPLDVDTDGNRKLELIEAEFGITGFGVVVKILQKIYGDQGYYIEWTNDVALVFSRKSGVGASAVSEIVTAAIRRGFFDKALHEKYSILTSAGIQERYFNAVKRRKGVKVKEDYLLVDGSILPEDVNISSENVNISSENVNISEQSRVEKSKETPLPPKGGAPAAQREKGPDLKKKPDYKRVLELFAEFCPSFPAPTEVTKPREGSINSAGRTLKKHGLTFQQLFARAEASDYLTGRDGKWDKCGFDWILKPANLQKILEGNYDNKTGKGGSPWRTI